MKIERTEKGMWTIAILWIVSNAVAIVVMWQIFLLVNLGFFLFLIWTVFLQEGEK